MRVGIVGTGNVGAALIHHMADVKNVEEILVVSRKKETALAAIMDEASAHPQCALRMRVATPEELGVADVIVLTSGAQMKVGQTAADVKVENSEITNAFLKSAQLKSTAVVIGLATPVDDITPLIQKTCGLPKQQILGFGGDLDLNRLRYVLALGGKSSNQTELVGEHGRNAIPVYPGEANYAEVAKQVRTFLKTITSYGGSPRNIATGYLLSLLVSSITTDSGSVHRVCGYHPELQCYLTWPFQITKSGVGKACNVTLEANAKADLMALVEQRRSTNSPVFQ